jgi:hypothetical protein
MDNRGKIWSIDDDQKLMESPQLSNAFFSQSMGRSENAIKFRRSHLAAKMFQNDPSTTLEEYVGLMNGDLDHAHAICNEWQEKRASLKSFLDTNRKRKAREMSSLLAGIQPQQEYPPQQQQRSPFFQRQHPQEQPPAAPESQPPPLFWPTATVEARIDAICKSIREEGGNLASVFNDPQFLSTIIQHYPGFEAYARVVQARVS